MERGGVVGHAVAYGVVRRGLDVEHAAVRRVADIFRADGVKTGEQNREKKRKANSKHWIFGMFDGFPLKGKCFIVERVHPLHKRCL